AKTMADLEDLLLRTSRTFALSIPHLPEPIRREVTLAYLLFRIADTFEDAPDWPRREKTGALEEFSRFLDGPEQSAEIAAAARRWWGEVPCAQSGYRDLLAEVPYVLDCFFHLAPEAVEVIRHHTRRTISGMAGYVARGTDRGELSLADLEDLRGYCYVVAGIVGELLTDLFVLGQPQLLAVAGALRERAPLYGEGLQLVNILKDSAADALEGRRYIPVVPGATEQEVRGQVMTIARRDLEAAVLYVLDLQGAGAARGLVAFNALPLHLAQATLDRVEHAGPGSKLTRPEVLAIVQRMNGALDRNEPAVWNAPDRPLLAHG
ncbi:MAG TPA: squalene/phytoene synthase family protein, partial [Thermoanaerobaculia bacterium]|nr:squalene/phytoene synthase family protein [Thermoanaerobaculia bacterium]